MSLCWNLHDVSRTEILRLRRQEAELKAEITNKRNSYFKDAQAEFNETEEQLESINQALVQKERQQAENTARSARRHCQKYPCDNRRGVIRPGEDVMEIVPIEEDFVIEAKLSPSDVGFVHLDQEAAVKVDAFDYTIYGNLLGNIIYISADTLEEKNSQGEASFIKSMSALRGGNFPARRRAICRFCRA